MTVPQLVVVGTLIVAGTLLTLLSCRRAGKLIISVGGDRKDPSIKSRVETMSVTCFYGLILLVSGIVMGLIFWFKL